MSPPHPELAAWAKASRLSIQAVSGFGWAMLGLPPLWVAVSGRHAPLEGLLLVLAGAVGWALLRRLAHRFQRTHTVQAQVGAALLDAPAQPMRLEFDAALGVKGYFARLHPAGGPPLTLWLELARTELPPRGFSPVEVHTAPNPERLLLIRRAGHLFFAHLLDRTGLGREQRYTGWMLSGLLALVMAMLLGAISLLATTAWQEETHARLDAASRHWPSVPGAITASSIQVIEEKVKGGTRRSYLPEVRYRYRVGERELEGGRLWFSLHPDRRPGEARAVLERYPTGRALAIHHDPQDPALALLEPGHEREGQAARNNAVYAIIAFGLVGVVIQGLLLGLLVLPNRRKLQRYLAELPEDTAADSGRQPPSQG